MACRAPGGITSPDALWTALVERVDACKGAPPGRADDLDNPPAHGGFLDEVADFDPAFFRISPREARLVDPQQRLALEAAWEALEDAGIVPGSLAEARAGVFVGAMWAGEYQRLCEESGEPVGAHAITGWDNAFISGRIAHVLGLRGPALTVNSASSSSAVAVHLACESLWRGEIQVALAGGVNLMLTPQPTAQMSALGTQSPTGRCRPFDVDGDGYVRSEAVGVVALMPLEAAQAGGHRIYALIGGSAVGNDGGGARLTAPSAAAQTDVLRGAWARAGVSPSAVAYVEAHGTGTPVGDPIEAAALGQVFGPGRAVPLPVGSIKGNLGHAEGAAGILGLLKAALALHHGALPATINHRRLNPAIDARAIEVVVDTRTLPAGEPRCVGVSSFGLSGTHCHLALVGAPPAAPSTSGARTSVAPITAPIVVSGHSESALRSQADRWHRWLATNPDVDLDSVRRSSAVGRSHLSHRAAVSGDPGGGLAALAAGEPHADVTTGLVVQPAEVVFIFPGQGSQWHGMGRALLDDSAVFAEAIAACEVALGPYVDWSLAAVLRGEDEAALDRVDVVQPVLFAMSVGLAAVWRDLGVVPSGVVGHSQGEIAAAVVAGALSLTDGARVVALRSRLLRTIVGRGAMAVIERPVDEVEARIVGTGLSIAVVNTATSTVVAGSVDAIDAFVTAATDDGLFSRRIQVDYASHSAAVDAILPSLVDALDPITPAEGHTPMASTVSGTTIDGVMLDADYWCRNLRSPVRLDRALASLGQGVVLLELSPHPVLVAAIGPRAVGSLRRDDGGWGRIERSLGALHVMGYAIDWPKLVGRGPMASLPGYAFQRRRVWPGEATSSEADVTPALTIGLASLPPEERTVESEALVIQAVRAALGHSADAPIHRDMTFDALGVDSMIASELREHLQRSTGVALPSGVAFAHPSVARLAAALVEAAAEGAAVAPLDLPIIEPGAPFPSTPIQQAYWVGRQTGGAGCHLYYEVDADALELPRLEAAWQRVIRRHDALRVVFTADGQQRVLVDVEPYVIAIDDLSDLDRSAREARLAEVRRALSTALRPADRWPLFELRAHRLPGGRARVHLDLDLLQLDAAGVLRVVDDWARLYAGEALPPPSAIGLPRCVLASHAPLDSARAVAARAYWTALRPGFEVAPQLPLRPGTPALRTRRHRHTLPAEVWQMLRVRARERGLTPSMTLCAAFCEVVAIWSGWAPFVMNLTRFGRPPLPDAADVVGEFTDVTYLVCEPDPATPFDAWAEAAQRQFRAHLAHADALPGTEVARLWSSADQPAAPPVVFTSLLGHEPCLLDGAFGWLGEQVYGISQTPHVWLDHLVAERGGALVTCWDVVEQRFPPGLVDEMLHAYATRLRMLASDDAAWQAARWDRLTPAHRARITRVNDTAVPPSPETLCSLTRQVLPSRAEAPAIVVGDETISHGALHAIAIGAARRLREHGIEREERVAIIARKGWRQVAAALAVLYAGGAYLPIDRDWPIARRRKLLDRGGARFALVEPDFDGDLIEGVDAIEVDHGIADGTRVDWPLPTPDDLAYVLFTSGSTGEPKGAMLSHAGPVDTIRDINTRIGAVPGDAILGLSDLSFDLSVYDIFGVLGVGGTLVLPAPDRRADPRHWAECLRGVTLWNTVPALMGVLVEYAQGRPDVIDAMQSLRAVLLSGDFIPVGLPDAIKALVPGVRIISLGGATEGSIWSISYDIGDVDPTWPSIPYGKPLTNQRFHVLDADLEPCPLWVPGELYIGGRGVALGYLGDPERTAASFFDHPRTGERVYRTGDWGRWLPGDDIEILGRRDQQVKINGYRIELGEVEACFNQHPGVHQAVAIAIGDREKRLELHAVAAAGGAAAWPPPPVVPTGGGMPPAPSGDAIVLPVSAVRATGTAPIPGPSADLSVEALAALLAPLRRVAYPDGILPKALYASAGSLYPVRVFAQVASGAVDGLAGGLWYHHPIRQCLVRVGPAASDDTPGPGLTLLLVGHLPAIAPFYGPWAPAFCAIEAGEVAELIAERAAAMGSRLAPVALRAVPAALCDDDDRLLSAFSLVERGSEPAALIAIEPRPFDSGRARVIADSAAAFAFKVAQPGVLAADGEAVKLPAALDADDTERRWTARRSVRAFDDGPITVEALGAWLSALDGSLDHPLGCLVNVARGGVRGLTAGLYRYDPAGGRVASLGEPINPRGPRPIFASARVVVLFTGRAPTAPIGAPAPAELFFAVGRACQRLEAAAAALDLGACQLGALDIDALAGHLPPGAIYLHALACGPCARTAERARWGSLAHGDAVGEGVAVDPETLDAWCRARLPHYMVPRRIHLHRALPLTANGKVDRKALAAHTSTADAPPATVPDERPNAASTADRAGLTETVRRLAKEVFDTPELGLHTPFGDIGVDSLMAIRFRGRLEKALGIALPVTLVYDHPSLAAIVRFIAPDAPPASTIAEPRAPVDDAIAIIGMACRTPGGVDDPDGLWRLLVEGRDATGPFPARYLAAGLYDPDPDAAGKTTTTRGGFLDDPAGFDAAFFGITPREATGMDPQQRLILELAWEAIERAGLAPDGLAGSDTGVFIGAMGSDYGPAPDELPRLDGYVSTGRFGSVLSGRVAYVLGLHGPALTVDTACSSSLVALHLAVGALRRGECSMALVGGVQVMSTPAYFVEFSRLRVVSPEGRCKSFAADADGTAWAEGCGMVLLKPLREALRDGDPIRAVVRGTAVNQDGRSQGLTAPNGPSQQRVIRQALDAAGLAPGDIDAVEAHGTGTVLGDPIEAGALAAVHGSGRPTGRPLRLGSLKSNIGHTQGAAGVLGLIKLALALEHETLPPTLHVDQPTPHVDWQASGLSLLTEATPWPRGATPRRAGVSAFGISGTNAHAIVEEAPTVDVHADPMPATLPLLLSGHTSEALRGQAERWHDWLGKHPNVGIDAARRTAAMGRSHMSHRASVDDIAALAALAAGVDHPGVFIGVADGIDEVVFAFPGHGSQWHGMGGALLDASPAFAEAVDACDVALAPHIDWSVRAVLRGDADAQPIDGVDVAQVAIWAMGISLTAAWRALGVEPAAVVGHSVGEVAAAVVAGALSLEDGARIVAHRGRLISDLPQAGAMLSVQMGPDALAARLEGTGLTVAVVNGANSTVASGDVETIVALEAALASEGVFCRRVHIGFAAHSHHMDGILNTFSDAIEGIRPRRATIPIYSSVIGGRVDGEALDVGYWQCNVRDVVRFDLAISALAADGWRGFVEQGGHPVLKFAVEAGIDGAVHTGTLRRSVGGLAPLHRGLGQLHVAGHAIDWRRVMGSGPRAALPTYAFQRTRYWLAPRREADVGAGLTIPNRSLLGAVVPCVDEGSLLLTGRLDLARHPWLGDHRVSGEVTIPGTALLDMVVGAATAAGRQTIEELVFTAPLVLPEGGAVDVQLRVAPPDEAGRRPISIHANSDGEWRPHGIGALAADDTPLVGALTRWPPPGEPVDVTALYPRLVGLDYGPGFRGLVRAWRDGTTRYAEVALPEGLDPRGHAVHPALLDAALHALADDGGVARLPFAWAAVTARSTEVRALRVRMIEREGAFAVLACDGSNAPVLCGQVSLREATLHSVPRDLRVVEWQTVVDETCSDVDGWLWLGPTDAAFEVPRLDGLAALRAALDAGRPAPTRLIVDVTSPRDNEGPAAARAAAAEALAVAQALLVDARLDDTAAVWVTRGAIAIRAGDTVPDLARASIWGLLRSARAEHPNRVLRAVDLDVGDTPRGCLAHDAEPELAVRGGRLYAPRLVAPRRDLLAPPADAADWALDPGARDGLAGVRAVAINRTPPSAGMVRVEVRAAGLNFRDVLNAMGVVPHPWLGLELAGVVTAVGPRVADLACGDRVFGLGELTFATTALAARDQLARIPAGLSDVEAATTPLAFLTALYGLVELAELKRGERVLIHAAAGGVGMAAVQLARHIGAEVFATASPAKWPALQAMGIAGDHIASSRTLDFEAAFLARTGHAGVDVVLDALAGDFVDASLRLLPRGGRFIEMGKTDVRDPDAVRAAHPAVAYRAFDLGDAGPEVTRRLMARLAAALDAGSFLPLPHAIHDLRGAREAFDDMAQARHIGKRVLQPPRPLEGPVLITGGTGALGQALARHLVERHGVRRLVLASRRGPDAPGAAALADALTIHGAKVELIACDVADEAQVGALLATCPPAAIFHLAGALDDGVLTGLDAERLDRVMRPKVDGAWHLHRLAPTSTSLILFSSVAGVLGAAGQSNYAAANAWLDALAAHRRATGLRAQSLAWGGVHQDTAGMTSHLDAADRARLERAGVGFMALTEGLALLDAALDRPEPTLVPARLDLTRLVALRRPAAEPIERPRGVAVSLSTLPTAQRLTTARKLVRQTTAEVMKATHPDRLDPRVGFTRLGLDSLMAVQLRNRLRAATGIALPSTIVFDQPTIERLANWLCTQAAPPEAPTYDEAEIRRKLQRLPLERLHALGLVELVMTEPDPLDTAPAAPDPDPDHEDDSDADPDALWAQLAGMLEDPDGR